MTKKKNKDIMSFTMENIALNTGIIAGAGMVSQIGKTYPSPISDKITSGMEPLTIIPTVHAMGGIFGQLNNMNNIVKKKKR